MRPTASRCRTTARQRESRPPPFNQSKTRSKPMVSVAQLKDVPASPSLRPDITELRSRVAQIAPQIKARAHTTEKAGRVPEENIIALRNIGYFDIVKPAMFGGYEHDFDVLVELNIELAKACASTAWVGGLLAAHQWLIAGFPEQAQRDVWGSNPDALACGSYAPATKAVASNGGYNLTGPWSFASGCGHAQWVLCAAPPPGATTEWRNSRPSSCGSPKRRPPRTLLANSCCAICAIARWPFERTGPYQSRTASSAAVGRHLLLLSPSVQAKRSTRRLAGRVWTFRIPCNGHGATPTRSAVTSA